MKKSLLMKTMLLLCALMVGSMNGWATNYSYTFTAKVWSAAGSQTLSGVSWTMAGTGGAYFGYDGTKGQQFGSGSKPYSAVSLTTSGISGTITSVVVNTSGASSIVGTVAVSVGTTGFLCNSKTTASLTATATDYTFTGSASGDIVISWAQTSSKAIYVKSITVTYTTSEPSSNATFTNTTPSINYPATKTYSQAPTTADGYTGTITYSMTANTAGATINAESGLVTVTKGGEVTVKATAAFDYGMMAMNVIERLFAMVLHISLTVIVFYGVVNARKWCLPLAIALHMLMDTFAALYQRGAVSLWISEVWAAFWAVVSAFIAVRLYRKMAER